MKLFHMSFLNALRSIGAIHRIYLGKSHAKGISIGIGTRMGARILSLSLGFSKLKVMIFVYFMRFYSELLFNSRCICCCDICLCNYARIHSISEHHFGINNVCVVMKHRLLLLDTMQWYNSLMLFLPH